jgi:hypothetical protein
MFIARARKNNNLINISEETYNPRMGKRGYSIEGVGNSKMPKRLLESRRSDNLN